MKISGEWKVSSQEGGEEFIARKMGIMTLDQDGEVWSVRMDMEGHTMPLTGVGFEHNGYLCIARGIAVGAAELDGSVGLVRYDLQKPGNLPARWYHPSLDGRMSDGISTDGPTNSLTGEYNADYESLDGIAFNPLRKTILDNGAGYQFSWWDDEKFHYVGVGNKINGSLYAAWGPPGSIIQFVSYNIQGADGILEGDWIDHGRNKFGIESLSRV